MQVKANEWFLYCTAKNSSSSFVLLKNKQELAAAARVGDLKGTPDHMVFLALVAGLHAVARLGVTVPSLTVRSDKASVAAMIERKGVGHRTLYEDVVSIQASGIPLRFEIIEESSNGRALELCGHSIISDTGSSDEFYELYFDGGSRGNPGLSGAGAVLFKDGTEVWTCAHFVGLDKTNNQAEYTGLIIGMYLSLSYCILVNYQYPPLHNSF
jgi:ribonuclease HI